MADTTLLASTERLIINLNTPAPPPEPGTDAQLIHVSDIGAGFYLAYEQLRNIAEYREHHLLLRGAIARYLSRYVQIDNPEPYAQDLIVELTQAGYLANDSITRGTANQIDQLALQISHILAQSIQYADSLTVTNWLRQYMAVNIEATLAPDSRTPAVMQFAYEHYLISIDQTATTSDIADHIYRVALTCAIQRTIFKSDITTTRYYLIRTALRQPVPTQAQLRHRAQMHRATGKRVRRCAPGRPLARRGHCH